ncbi:tetratricopeptide repeat protein [Acidisoma sp.]|uniref:tetratricopeptide repeat protein n=1 Tax=Acidisoma sp. TaxID=1872115 RepID=UPI003B007C47
MVDIFDEVDEDLRAERMSRFARRYAIGFMVLAVLLIAGVGGWQAWLWHRHQEDAKAATAFIAVLDQAAQHGSAADREALARKFGAVAQSAPSGYATLARLNEASLLADAGKQAAAEAVWNGLINNGSLNPVLRQVATIGWAAHAIDTAEPSLIQARLETLAAEGSPWRPVALQYLALLDIRLGHKSEAARTLLEVANDISTPDDMRRMANGLAQALGAPASTE